MIVIDVQEFAGDITGPLELHLTINILSFDKLNMFAILLKIRNLWFSCKIWILMILFHEYDIRDFS